MIFRGYLIQFTSVLNKANIKIPSCVDCKNDSNIFCTLSRDEKDKLGANKVNNFYKKGQTIFYEGNQSHGLFCVYTGKIKLSKLSENGKEQIIRLAKKADILGYRSLFSNEPYQATAVALEDSYVCLLPKDKVFNLLQSNPKMSWKTLLLLSNDLKKAENHLTNIAQKTVIERIAEALLLLHSTFGFENTSNIIDVRLTRTEIGEIAGTTTETTIRTLAKLKKEGLIALDGKKIGINNVSNLANIAKIYD